MKLANAAIQQFLKLREQGGERKETDGRIAGGKTEFACEGAAARGLHVDQPMGNVLALVGVIRRGQAR